MRKLVYGALALTAALTLSIGSVSATDADPTSAPAESKAPAESTVDFKSIVTVNSLQGDTLVIDAGGAQEVLVGTAKVSKGKTGSVMKVAAWDTYVVGEEGVVYVDLSKIATTKDSYLRIKADSEADSDAVTIKFPAVSSKLKATYDKEKEAILVTDNKAAVAKDMILTWRTVNHSGGYVQTKAGGVIDSLNESFRDVAEGEEDPASSESPAAETDNSLETYRMSGGVLYLSTAQEMDEDGSWDWMKNVKTDIMEADGATPIAMVTAPVRCSKELKVTIAKRANAPKLSVNYVNGTIAIPAKAQYRILNTEGDLPKFEAATTAKITLTLGTANDKAKNIIDASNPFAIDVMTAKDGKKPASKIGHTTFAAQGATTTADIDVKDPVVNTKPEKDKTTYTVSVSMENKSKTETYAFTYTPYGATKAKTVKVAPGKTATATKVVTASAVSLQRVGNAKTQSWAGTALTFDSLKDFQAGAATAEAAKTFAINVTLPAGATSESDLITSIVNAADGSALDKTKIDPGVKVGITATAGNQLTITGPEDVEESSSGFGASKTYTYTFTMPAKNVSVEYKG